MKFPQCHTCSKNMTTCCPGEDFCQGQSRMIKSDTQNVSDEKVRVIKLWRRNKMQDWHVILSDYDTSQLGPDVEIKTVIEYSAFKKLQSENTMMQAKLAELEKELCETRDQSDKRKELQIQISEHNEELIEENNKAYDLIDNFKDCFNYGLYSPAVLIEIQAWLKRNKK